MAQADAEAVVQDEIALSRLARHARSVNAALLTATSVVAVVVTSATIQIADGRLPMDALDWSVAPGLVIMLGLIFAYQRWQHWPLVGRLLGLPRPSGSLGFAPATIIVTNGRQIENSINASILAPLAHSPNAGDRCLLRDASGKSVGEGLLEFRRQSEIEVCPMAEALCEVAAEAAPPCLPDFSRLVERLSDELDTSITWVRQLKLTPAELLRRLETFSIAALTGREELRHKLAYSAALPYLLVHQDKGALARALNLAAAAVKTRFDRAGQRSDSIEWFRSKLTHPCEALIEHLLTDPTQPDLYIR